MGTPAGTPGADQPVPGDRPDNDRVDREERSGADPTTTTTTTETQVPAEKDGDGDD